MDDGNWTPKLEDNGVEYNQYCGVEYE